MSGQVCREHDSPPPAENYKGDKKTRLKNTGVYNNSE